MKLESLALLEEYHPDLADILNHFIGEEVRGTGNLSLENRYIAISAALVGCQGFDLFKEIVKEGIHAGVAADAFQEVVYQGCAYLGIGRTYPFLAKLTEAYQECGIALPLESNRTVEKENRFEAGLALQIKFFGEGMKNTLQVGPEDERFIRLWLGDNCFGDYYTRKGLTHNQREMITVCFLMGQGACEPQLKGHLQANMGIGNSREFLIEVIGQCMPYIGYPRTLNAFAALDAVCQ
ncbi:MAG: carboxymuconolactone decarboxylase family protein [Erysipelotrichaceae bacterium]|nr:carboxymuconolactone decarboxylase family protein [Erysipelotrichaceae bacterium]